LDQERSAGKVIFPPEPQTFTALNLCPINEIKVVILGQDPYHGPNQAMGMAFSVNRGVAVPPSLQNMYKELNDDIPGFKIPGHGNLEGWARQGVLLLNTVLSVVKATAGSHQGQGWEQFTDHIIRLINEKSNNVVFILWGVPAQKKAPLINTKKHFILKGPHPSPLSAHKGFFGCKHFSQANKLLEQAGRAPINWSQLDVVPPKDPSVSQPQPQPQPQPTSDPAATDSANSNAGTAEAKQPESDYAT
jgi:uracil-DNA glycosylase